ncbi:unnamed protein product [Candida verbasci]|uniref:RING-type domain-containing protein n=1 Tax=Candida verbasci TaxID=1227364 RepID=A0A9W4XAL8_9ASCO|nr:unnamed protein product [Candida verbasci]
MSVNERYVINLSSDEGEIDDNDIEIIEFRKLTQNLINNPQAKETNNLNDSKEDDTTHEDDSEKVVKKLSDSQCPICFDEITNATITSCGHLFCLECIEQSISNSSARGQIRSNNNNSRGKGLCPLCRKQVSFKDTILLKMKKSNIANLPKLG